MSRFMPEPKLRLSIGRHAVGLVAVPWLRRVRTASIARSWLSLDNSRSWEQGVRELLGQDTQGWRRLEVVIDDAYLRWFDLQAPVGTHSPDELRAATALRFENLFECDASQWILRADWSAQNRYAACALPMDWRSRLDQILQAQRCIAHSLRSALVDQARRLSRRRTTDWLVIRTREQSWVAGIRAKRLIFVQAQSGSGPDAPPFACDAQPPHVDRVPDLGKPPIQQDSAAWQAWAGRLALWRDLPLPPRLYGCDETVSPLPLDPSLPLWQLQLNGLPGAAAAALRSGRKTTPMTTPTTPSIS